MSDQPVFEFSSWEEMIFPCCKKQLPAPLDGVAAVDCPCGNSYKPEVIIEFNRLLDIVKAVESRLAQQEATGGNMSEPSCPFCGESLFETYNNLDGTTRPMCGICGAIWPCNRYQENWNNRPGEATARLTAFEEGEQWTIAFIQSHFYDRPDEIECLEKDIADAFQILKEKP